MKVLDIDIGDRKLILGSSSEGRRLVVESLGVPFSVLSPDIDEKAIRRDDPKDLTLAIANAKADALVAKVKEPAVIVVSDQVSIYKGSIREKAKDEKEARDFLRSYRDAPAGLVGAVVVLDTVTGRRAFGNQSSLVYFKDMSEDFIDGYIGSGRAFVGSGGFGIQHEELKAHVDHIEGTLESVMGLDKDLLLKLIAEVVE